MHALRPVPADVSDLRPTKLERNSPRGRIALMRAIADDKLEVQQSVRRRNVFLPRLSRVHDGVSGGSQLRRVVRARTAEAEQPASSIRRSAT